ncbi:MAG: hypothetical protein OEZ36_05780 [Spirochaetota bacterium]|nr:hypothetical protein [Spirochaetota bacterium]
MGQGFKLISTTLSLGLVLLWANCGGEEYRFYLSYDPVKRVFKNEVKKNQSKGVKHYMVHLMNGQYHHAHLMSQGKVIKKFIYLKGKADYIEKIQRMNEKDKVYQVDYLYPGGEIKRIDYLDQQGKITRWEEFERVSDDMVEDVTGFQNPGSLKNSMTEFKAMDSGVQKIVTRYKYFIINKKLKTVTDNISYYEGKSQVKKEIYRYNPEGLLYSRKVFLGGKIAKIYYHDEEELLEEEHVLSESGKVMRKIYWDKTGKEIKRVEVTK